MQLHNRTSDDGEGALSADPRPAAGSWDADDSRGYQEFALRNEIETFISFYGIGAFIEQANSVGVLNGFKTEIAL